MPLLWTLGDMLSSRVEHSFLRPLGSLGPLSDLKGHCHLPSLLFCRRDFFNYLSEKDVEGFWRQLKIYLVAIPCGIPFFVFRDFYSAKLKVAAVCSLVLLLCTAACCCSVQPCVAALCCCVLWL